LSSSPTKGDQALPIWLAASTIGMLIAWGRPPSMLRSGGWDAKGWQLLNARLRDQPWRSFTTSGRLTIPDKFCADPFLSGAFFWLHDVAGAGAARKSERMQGPWAMLSARLDVPFHGGDV